MSYSQQKGKESEIEVARFFSVWMGQAGAEDFRRVKTGRKYAIAADQLWIRRTPNSGAWDKNKLAADLVVVNDHAQAFPFSVECKNRQAWDWNGFLCGNPGWPVWGYWQQCRENAKLTKQVPLLVFRRNNLPWFCCIDDEAVDLLSITGLEPICRAASHRVHFLPLERFRKIESFKIIEQLKLYTP